MTVWHTARCYESKVVIWLSHLEGRQPKMVWTILLFQISLPTNLCRKGISWENFYTQKGYINYGTNSNIDVQMAVCVTQAHHLISKR